MLLIEKKFKRTYRDLDTIITTLSGGLTCVHTHPNTVHHLIEMYPNLSQLPSEIYYLAVSSGDVKLVSRLQGTVPLNATAYDMLRISVTSNSMNPTYQHLMFWMI